MSLEQRPTIEQQYQGIMTSLSFSKEADEGKIKHRLANRIRGFQSCSPTPSPEDLELYVRSAVIFDDKIADGEDPTSRFAARARILLLETKYSEKGGPQKESYHKNIARIEAEAAGLVAANPDLFATQATDNPPGRSLINPIIDQVFPRAIWGRFIEYMESLRRKDEESKKAMLVYGEISKSYLKGKVKPIKD